LPFIRSYRIEFCFPYPPFVRGKLGALPPGPAALLPCTHPSSNGINGRYGHGFYGNGYGNGNRYVTVKISHNFGTQERTVVLLWTEHLDIQVGGVTQWIQDIGL